MFLQYFILGLIEAISKICIGKYDWLVVLVDQGT